MTSLAGSCPIAPLRWPVDAELTLPGSKSEANRLLVAAASTGREVVVKGATPCDDVCHLVAGLATMGFRAQFVDFDRGVVQIGPRRENPPTTATLPCGNAGTALRFLVSVAAVTPGDWTITGDPRMLRRPIGPLVAAWRQLGVEITDTNGCPPVHVRGAHCRGSAVTLDPTISSQFVSSLLLVGAGLPHGLDITFTGPLASADYARLTIDTLRRFGVRASLRGDGARVEPGHGTIPDELQVAGDWSAMGVWTCLQHLTGSRIRAANLHAGSGQADEGLAAVLQTLTDRAEHTIDVSTTPDQFLNLAIVAALRAGPTLLTGAANLRHKECDRIAVMARELGKCGARVEELPDGLRVFGSAPLHGAVIDPEHDHRVAMAFALLGQLVPGITVLEPECVKKSYPTFWADLDAVGRSHRAIAIIGMRGAGKSTFAKALAERTDSMWIDTDDRFVAAHGPIGPFVAQHGWAAFRTVEAKLVADALVPGAIVSLGGGAIEDPATRAMLRERAVAVWLTADAALLRTRLAADPGRPSLTGAPVLDEIDAVLVRRTPLYRDCAQFRLDAKQPTAIQVEQLLDRLGQHLRDTARLAAPRMLGGHS
jgi:3-phosphoshikimate 1-carboxyvinyltransferase